MEEVEALFARYRRDRSRRVRNQIVEAHLELVDYHVARYARGHTETDDARQQALVALIGAVERFDPAAGASFATFAARTIDGELKRLRRDRGWSVRPPRKVQELALHVRRAEAELAQDLGRQPHVVDIAEYLEESTDRVIEAIGAGGALQAHSLDAPPPGDDDGASLGAKLHSSAPGLEQIDRELLVEATLAQLEDRDRRILELRFRDQLSQEAIADEIGVSQSYLSRLLRRAVERARWAADLDG